MIYKYFLMPIEICIFSCSQKNQRNKFFLPQMNAVFRRASITLFFGGATSKVISERCKNHAANIAPHLRNHQVLN